jgi:predicted RNA-binding Zn-ribbon protein involved in translation (DUF1610 family)
MQRKNTILKRLLLGALFSLVIILPTYGDSLYEIYAPVTTPTQARSIKPGTRVAFVCGGCGAVTTMTVGKDRSFLHGFTCPVCKRKFVTESLGGNVGSVGFSYDDDAGHHSKLLVMRHLETRYNANGQPFSVYAPDR